MPLLWDTMKLPDLRKTLDEMSDNEVLEELRASRHRRWVERPAVTQRASRSEAKEERSKGSALQRKLEKQLALMSEAERAEFLKLLGG